MALPAESVYNSLNGLETKNILHARFVDLLNQIPELQERFTLSRVKIRLELVMDIYAATPPRKIINDSFEARTVKEPDPSFIPVDEHRVLEAKIDAESNPPDLIREQHGLPIPTAIRTSAGFHADEMQLSSEPALYPPAVPPLDSVIIKPLPPDKIPANLPNPNSRQIGKRRYAAFVEQDYGAFVTGDRNRAEPPVIGGEKIQETGASGGHAPVQPDFRLADYRGVDPEHAKAVVEDTLNRAQPLEDWENRPPLTEHPIEGENE